MLTVINLADWPVAREKEIRQDSLIQGEFCEKRAESGQSLEMPANHQASRTHRT